VGALGKEANQYARRQDFHSRLDARLATPRWLFVFLPCLSNLAAFCGLKAA